MKLTAPATRLLLVLAVLCAVAFNGDANSFTFGLSCDQIFAPGDSTYIRFSGNNVGATTGYFRAFRIDDPVDFLLKQKDVHNPSLIALKAANTFDMLKLGYDQVRQDARYAARDVMPSDARTAIRDVADVNGYRARQRDEGRSAMQSSGHGSSAWRHTERSEIPSGAEHYPIVAAWEHSFTAEDNVNRWEYSRVDVPVHQRGVYLIEARVRGRRAMTLMVVSSYGMVIKQTDERAVAFVTDRTTGRAVGDVDLTFARGGKTFAQKATDDDGTLEVTIPPLPETGDDDEDLGWFWQWQQRQMLVVGEKDSNLIIADPYSYGDDEYDRYKVYTHTDRPVYRPAQTVYYRGVAREVEENGTYRTVGELPVYVEIDDARGDMVRRDTLALDDMGTFHGSVALGDEAALGTWSIQVRIDKSEHWFDFAVEEYKKPEYKVEITTGRKHYTRGDTIEAEVAANYFFGSPVTTAQVEYFVYRARYWRPWWRGTPWEYLFSEDDDFSTYRMEMVGSGEGTLDTQGHLAITWPTDSAADHDYVYRIQANVVDNSRRSISGARSVEVTRGTYYISTHTDRYVYTPGDKATVHVKMATFEGDSPVARPFTVTVLRTWWHRLAATDSNGKTIWQQDSAVVWTGSGRTNGNGEGSASFTVDSTGYFDVRISSTDENGTAIDETDFLWVSDSRFASYFNESDDIQIIPDKDSYRPGETMNALVIMPAPDIDVLITLEGKTIYSRQVEHLQAASSIVHIPISQEHAPMVYLSATAMVNDQLYSESKRVTVVPKDKLIKLEIQPDSAVHRPGTSGTLTIRAFDEQGNPAPNVDIAVGMVDEAIYSIRPDATPDIQKYFYGNRWNSVYTNSSLYFSFYGESRPIGSEDLLGDVGYGRRGMKRFDRGNDPRFLNVSYGDVKGQSFVQPDIRRTFKDMMYWNPSVRTGSDGVARLKVSYPDNLTTWRITARAVNAETAVGQAVARVVARKNLMLRVETPRFLVSGDELLIATTVHNYLSGDKTTKIEFSGSNLDVARSTQTLRIPANGERRVDWSVRAGSSGSARLLVKALTNEESDAVELSVPIRPPGLMKATATSLEVDTPNGRKDVTMTIPATSDPSAGSLKLTLNPSMASAMLGSLDGLIGYPYGCVEQTMSRFLPTVIVARTLDSLDLPFDAKRRAEIPKMVEKGFNKLYGMQHDDGAFGWWAHDPDDPFMTAYVVYGMTLAREAGYAPREDRYQSAVTALDDWLRGKLYGAHATPSPNTEAAMIQALAMARPDQPDDFLRRRIAELASRDSLNDYGVALLALADIRLGDRRDAEGLVRRLERDATSNGTFAFWKGTVGHFEWDDDAVEITAHAVDAILSLRGETDLTRAATRWLMSHKVDDGWENTRQTAMVIYSLVDHLRQTGELEPDFDLTVRVNGRNVYSGHLGRADVFRPASEIRIPRDSLPAGTTTISLEKRGRGRIYATARATYWSGESDVRPASSGFRVQRQYWKLSKTKRGDTYVYTKVPFAGTVATGDELLVKVTVKPDMDYQYVMLEDPLPAGCEVVENTSGYTIPGEKDYDEDLRESRGWWMWYWPYAEREVRDEKVAFFSRYMDAKPAEFTYILRAQIPGRYAMAPTTASLMYYPEIRGNGSSASMRITP